MSSGRQGTSELSHELNATLLVLKEERNRFEAVLQTMATAVIALDQQGRITTVNRSAKTLFGFVANVEGRTLLEAIRIPALYDLTQRATTVTVETAEFELPASQRQILARASRQVGGGVVIVADDVTEVRHLERVRRDFVANLSHELRTPIAVIRASSETLLDGGFELPEQARTFVEALYRHSNRLSALVQELLDISRIEAGKFTIHLEPIEMHEIVEDVTVSLHRAALAKNVQIHNLIAPNVWGHLDAKGVEQVLTNLVDNGIKYTPSGSIVEVLAKVLPDGKLRVEVRDNGPGLDASHRLRIFERFYRVDPGRSRDMGGTGLGLSIVKHLVEAMGGQVGVEPRSPRGSTFWFTCGRCEPPDELG